MGNQFELSHHLQNDEVDNYQRLVHKMKTSPIPNNEILANIGLYLNRSSLARILFFDELYKQIINNHGVIIAFGVRWGQTLNVMSSMRSIYEPYNISRKIIGFDTFSGFPAVTAEDGSTAKSQAGNYSVSDNYQTDLEELLQIQEDLNPKSSVK